MGRLNKAIAGLWNAAHGTDHFWRTTRSDRNHGIEQVDAG
jgi:hypothetical protein